MFRTYAQLIRLPNVFTALADICLGAVAVFTLTGSSGERWLSFAALLLSSACLYCAGMVWNDVFDVEQDRRERPFRPIPSGRVSRRAAVLVGSVLLAVGLACAAVAGWTSAGWHCLSLVLAGLLVVMILAYDGVLKRTLFGPVAMGACRFLNVLLGVSVAGQLPGWSVHLAIVVGCYIAGVTWLARTEAQESQRWSLIGAAVTMLFALAVGLLVPMHFPTGSGSVFFPYLLVGLAFVLGFRLLQAIENPGPVEVQLAVRRAIFGLVALDAILACGIVGILGLAVLILLLPTLYLGRWIYST
jgi:4-hydroxybenzoate polyprenyltransferase